MVVLLGAGPARAAEIPAPMKFPGAGASAAGARDWLIGIRRGAATPAGTHRLRPGTIVVPRARARAVAGALERRGDLLYAEPDRLTHRATAFDFDLTTWARGAVVPATVPWPGSGPVAVVDSFVDATAPDLTGHVGYLNATASSLIDDAHGTEVASSISGSYQGTGVTGVLPGAPILSYGVPEVFGCSESAAGIDASVAAGARVVNTSYGSSSPCYTEYLAVQHAYGVGALVVASAGNDYQDGNPVLYPAAFPHVMSVAAVNQDLNSAEFSSANAAVDVSAPGVGVPVALPVNFDTEDGSADGLSFADGTSFSAPMVAGAAAWVRSVRPDLGVGQVADALRFSARDLAVPGYDDDTGWGLVDVVAALGVPTPEVDPLEPNDGIAFVDGRVFKGADNPVFNGRGARSLTASADQWEDPLDVYRVRLRPRSRTRITLAPRFGDSDLTVYDQGARKASGRRKRVCRSVLGVRATDECVIDWDGRGKRIIFVAVNVATSDEGIASSYTLTFRRVR